MDYSRMKKAQLIEEIEALEKKLTELERAEAERKRAEEALRDSEQHLKGILSSLHESFVAVYDHEGNYKSVWGPPELQKLYGISSAEAVGRSVKDVLPPQEAKERITHIQRVFETGEPWRGEYLVRLPGGDFWHDVSLSPMWGKGNCIYPVRTLSK